MITNRLAFAGLLLAVACMAPGCSRERYHQAADREVYQLIAEKSYDPRWALPGYNINTDPRARYFDPTNPDRPPIPLDDPDSHVYMHRVDGKNGYRRWHQYGEYYALENPAWREMLEQYAEVTEEGVVVLRLEDAIRLGIMHSPNYRSQIETLYLSSLDVSAERFRFDTQFFGTITPSFTHVGAQRPGGETNTLRTDQALSVRRRFATGGDLLVGFANSFVWQFAGPDTNFASSLINFSLIQPLLRAGGKAVVLEQLTIVERALLANLRAYERYRQGFYTQVAIGDLNVTGPQRRGGFFGGTGLTGFTGQGAGGLGGVGTATGFGRGGFGGAGGGGANAGTGFAGGGEANVGGYIGLLQQTQQIRNSEETLAAQVRALGLLEANYEAGLIDLSQVDQFRQSIETERATLLQSRNGLQNQIETFNRATLGLPPDLPIELDDTMIRQFQLISPDLLRAQFLVSDFIDSFGERAGASSVEEVLAALGTIDEIRSAIRAQFDQVQGDLDRLEGRIPSRLRTMQTEPERTLLMSDIEELHTNLAGLRARLSAVIARADAAREGLDPNQPSLVGEEAVDLASSLGAILSELSIVQARARLESVSLDPFSLSPQLALAISRANRLDWMNNRASLVDTWRLIEFNANALLSGLDINFSGEIGTIGDNPLRFRAPNGTLRASLRFDAPLTRLLERNNYRQVLIDYQADRRQLIGFEDQINQTLRALLRQLDQTRQNLEIQRRAVSIAVRRVDQNRETLNEPPAPVEPGQTAAGLGPTAALDLLNAISDLRNTQNNLMSAWLSYYATRMTLMRDLGIMQIDENGLWIDEPFDAEQYSTLDLCPLPPAVPPEWIEEMMEGEEVPPGETLPTPADEEGLYEDLEAERIHAPVVTAMYQGDDPSESTDAGDEAAVTDAAAGEPEEGDAPSKGRRPGIAGLWTLGESPSPYTPSTEPRAKIPPRDPDAKAKSKGPFAAIKRIFGD